MTYGLIKRDAPSDQATDTHTPPPPPLSSTLPVATREWEEARYKEDLAALPPEPSIDAYEATPVEAFGEALLRGMGWTGALDGEGGGADASITRRPALLGLGAAAAAPPPPRQVRKPGEAEPPPPLPPAAAAGGSGDGQTALTPGTRVRVIGGRHAGLDASVVSATPHAAARGGTRVRVALLPSEVEATVDAADVEVARRGERTRRDDDDDERRRRRDNDDERRRRDRGHGSSDASDRKRRRSRSRSPRPHTRRAPSPPWLLPGIVVRVVSTRVAGGSLYLRRATVIDVPTPGTATLAPHGSDETTSSSSRRPVAAAVTGVPQSALETALPRKTGGHVRVVRGPHRGRAGTLLAKGEAAVAVQLAGELEVVKLPLDAVVEGVGAEDDE